ncbi:MerR family transcriptional regulator, partial [Pseudonocardia lacus]|uniref:MerR family transcriptional regulator n=1 Tax=Pseudonocardia lacus TaxID=2835865 RepID=UPI0038B4F55D
MSPDTTRREITGTGQPGPVPVAGGDGPVADRVTGSDDDPVEADQPSLGVAAAARRLGVAPATLRTWDRRYGLGPSGHSPGRHRRYSAQDLARLDVMRRALLRGVSAADAAQHARTSPLGPGSVRTGAATGAGPAPSNGSDAVIGVPRKAGGGVLRLGAAAPAARGLG